MKNLSSWLIVIFMVAFIVFRTVVALTASMGGEFMVQPIDLTMEIILLFVALLCVPFIFKRQLIGALIYLVAYGWYFGQDLLSKVMILIEGNTLSVPEYTTFFFSLVGIALPIFALFDILLDKGRKLNPTDKKTDWYYKNEQYDRELDERADKNNYRTL